MVVEGGALPPQPTDRRETQNISSTLPIQSTRPFSFLSWLSNLIISLIHSIEPNNNPALSGQHSDHLPKIVTDQLPTGYSTFSSVGSRNHDQFHLASVLISASPPYYQNYSIPSSSSSSSSSPLISHRHLDPSPTFSSLPSSSFNYSPPKNIRPKRHRVFNSFHCGEVGSRRGYTDSTSPPPNHTQPQNNTKLVLPPIIKLFREQELSKVMFLLTVPIIAALVNIYNRTSHPPPPVLPHIILGLLLFGIMFIWNGLLLKETCPRISVGAELLGSSSVILALVLLVACVVPGVTRPWLLAGIFCFGLWLGPFVLALSHLKN